MPVELDVTKIYPDENGRPITPGRRRSMQPPVELPDLEVSSQAEPLTSKRRLFSQEQKELLSKLSANDENRHFFGIAVVCINTAVVFRWPQHYWMLYLVQCCVLLPLRFIRFKRSNEELLLLDFCYWVQLLIVAWILGGVVRTQGRTTESDDDDDDDRENTWTKYDQNIFLALFIWANGALAWSVAIYKNRVVFHQVDHMTSTFVHLCPAVLTWALRWGAGMGPGVVNAAWPDMFRVCGQDADLEDYAANDACVLKGWCSKGCEANGAELLGWPLVVYLAGWAVPYFLIVLVACADAIKKHGKETLYSFSLVDPGPMKQLLMAVPEEPTLLRPAAYMLTHFFFMALSGFLSLLWWNSFWCHTAFLGMLALLSIKNGGNWMFHYFALRYAEALLQGHMEDLKEAEQKGSPAPIEATTTANEAKEALSAIEDGNTELMARIGSRKDADEERKKERHQAPVFARR